MRSSLFSALLLLLAISVPARAQSLQPLAGNTLMGTANGTLLGLGTMALANSGDPTPLRVGVGMGTLYGLGLGIYDLTYTGIGNGSRIDGMFNSAGYTGQIILMDTFYGGATGGIVGVAIALMVNEPLVEGLQYGVGTGLWAGFAFGLADAFYYSNTIPDGLGSAYPLQIRTGQNTSVGFLEPGLAVLPGNDGAGHAGLSPAFKIDVARVQVRF